MLAANWIWRKQGSYRPRNQTVIARRRFSLKSVALASIKITADCRYRLLINGEWVNDGPARSWPEHYQYDEIDVTSYLTRGPNLIEVVGRRKDTAEEKEDEEEVILSIIFHLYNNCFFKIRNLVESVIGEHNQRFPDFVSQYRSGVFTFFPGVEPGSDLTPSFDKFITAIRAIPAETRFHKLMSGLENMLSEQLEYVFQLLGISLYRETVLQVKKEVAEPLAVRRELVKRYGIDDSFYKSVKRADKVVKMVRG